jgi:hypothetical protein
MARRTSASPRQRPVAVCRDPQVVARELAGRQRPLFVDRTDVPCGRRRIVNQQSTRQIAASAADDRDAAQVAARVRCDGRVLDRKLLRVPFEIARNALARAAVGELRRIDPDCP